MSTLVFSTVPIHSQRTYGAAPNWLLTLDIGLAFNADCVTAYPQSRAVVDDFGTLVIVREWR